MVKDYERELSKKQISLLERSVKAENECFIRFLESDCQDTRVFDELEKPKTKKTTIKALYDLHSSGVTLKNIEKYMEQLNSVIHETKEEEDPFIFHQDPPIEHQLQEHGLLNHEHLEWTTNLLEEVAALDLQRLIKRRIDRQQSLSKGYITTRQKEKDWPEIKQRMLQEGFTEEMIHDFHTKHYKAGETPLSKKKRRTRKRKKTNKQKRM